MGDLSVTNLYRKVVSPSMKFKADELKKESHTRHVQYRGRSPVSPRRIVPSPTRSTCSAPGRVESREIALQSSLTYGCHGNGVEQDGHYNFYPTTRFKTTSLPAMPLTKKYANTAPGSTRTVPLSVTRHSALSLPEKWPNDKPLFTTQRQRKSAKEIAKSDCRRLKRKSEIISHRIDKQYYMSGIKIPVKSRWDVDTNDLLRLKLLAHHKQLANYEKMKSLQNELQASRESPGGQVSTPTPNSDKENGSGQPRGLSPEQTQALGKMEGKWAAEDSKSETSSIDEFDCISMRGRRIKLPSGSQQNGDTSDDIDGGKKEEELGDVSLDKQLENDNIKESEKLVNVENSTDKKKESKEREEGERIKKEADGGLPAVGKETGITAETIKHNMTENDNTKDQKKKPVSPKPHKKVKSIRFKDEINVKNSNKNDKMKDKDGKSGEVNQEDKSDHVNPYLDEWLGVKKKEVDGRYKPGKPPPNRIFISTQIPKSKKAEVAKFSEMFLTETIALQENQANLENDATPESKFGIINSKQKGAFKTMFDEVDKDKNGSVTLEELKLKMMPAVTRDDIKHFVQVFDLNKDKTVDSREFTTICSLNDRLAGTRTETADGSIALELEKLAQHIVIFKEMYKTMDEDDDNRLDANEVLIMVSAAMETEMGADLDVARRVLDAAQDEFGYIDFIGFISYIPFFAKLLKTIMSKPLSIAEIEKARDRVKQKELTFKPKKSNKKEPKSWEAF